MFQAKDLSAPLFNSIVFADELRSLTAKYVPG